MAQIIEFSNRQYPYDKTFISNFCRNLYARMSYLYKMKSTSLIEVERELYHELERMEANILSEDWLTLEEGNLFVPASKEIITTIDEEVELKKIMNYFYLTVLKKRDFLSQSKDYIQGLVSFFAEEKGKPKEYDRLLDILLNREVVKKVKGIEKLSKSGIFSRIMNEIDFDEEDSLDKTKLLLDDYKNSEPMFDRNFESVYAYYEEQAYLLNQLAGSLEEPLISEKKIEQLEDIFSLETISEEKKETFFDALFLIQKKYCMMDQIEWVLNFIEIYREKSKDNIISFPTKGGVK